MMQMSATGFYTENVWSCQLVWVIWPVKLSPQIAYTVMVETLNPAHSLSEAHNHTSTSAYNWTHKYKTKYQCVWLILVYELLNVSICRSTTVYKLCSHWSDTWSQCM